MRRGLIQKIRDNQLTNTSEWKLFLAEFGRKYRHFSLEMKQKVRSV